jgi:FdrA protein
MIDPSIRDKRFERTLANEAVGIVLLDIVLGHGATMEPTRGIVDAMANSPGGDTLVVASVCGTDGDPQRRQNQVQALKDAGVVVAPSNAIAANTVAKAFESPYYGSPEQ